MPYSKNYEEAKLPGAGMPEAQSCKTGESAGLERRVAFAWLIISVG